MAKKKIINEQDALYMLKMILAKMNLDMAKHMLSDLNNDDKRTPSLYNAILKFLEQNEISFDKIASAKDDEGMRILLTDANDMFNTMLLEYDSFGEIDNG